ncbi:hypothetical protein SR42_15120 [Clostridium botulinum]|uniref:hypothetical protein n=1 Tax=Clostridium botulinum TaxID=1491 RepID=UPI000596F52E|nr:hypothetical protein [Clostridium botulinum]KIL06901.1 hypothetical protein SR42_15120 [Clostridium botulinum]MBY6935305.1 hypothetical protein [Clostridium botulinum]NFL82062.1 hypothetical protein [Clostridium botulinum]NFN13184.1 hypothetical protein [Clostridium botulinum]NFO38207.1 hypothetical protein [Clostridium botulinum]
MSDYPRVCTECGKELVLDTDYEGNDIVTNIICDNNNCNVDVVKEFERKSKSTAQKEYMDSLK